MVATGGRWALIGAALFPVGAVFFEVVVGIGGFGPGRFGLPVGLAILGVALLAGGMRYRRK